MSRKSETPEKVRYYKSFTDDFFQTDETFTLPENYRWIRTDARSRVLSALVYALALVFSNVYCRLFLHVRIRGAKKLRREKGGFFLYGNHTQPIGDVFDPALACFPKRIYTVVSPANLYLPVIGRLLPYLGALPIPDGLAGMRAFNEAIERRVRAGHPIVIYPEAHLWEYYTGVRPFPDASFKYPARLGAPVYAMTTTYQKRRFGRKPRATIWIDGPFFASGESVKRRAGALRDAVYGKMCARAAQSTCSYITYLPK